MTRTCNRREMLKITGQLVVAGAVGPNIAFAAESEVPDSQGLVAGQLSGAEVGNKVLREGGNAVDAAVAAALTAGVAVPNGCGIGGYGGHMVIALAGGNEFGALSRQPDAELLALAGRGSSWRNLGPGRVIVAPGGGMAAEYRAGDAVALGR